MKKNALKFLKALLYVQNPNYRDELLSYLPEKIYQELNSLGGYAQITHEQDLLNEIHYSWFIPFLKEVKHPENQYFLMALDESPAHLLESALSITRPTVGISNFLRVYLKSVLRSELIPEDLMPSGFVPNSSLNSLLSISKNQLIEMIHKLSLHDLGLEMRQIVETKILKKIYSSLTEEERLFLHKKTFEKDNIAWPKMHLEKWDGTKELLYNLMQKRGIYRLSAALQDASFELRWYLSHRLDTGRGNLLLKAKDLQIPSQAKEKILEQVHQIYSEMQK